MADDVTVDASVWIAAGDNSDAFHIPSRQFLSYATRQGAQFIVPAFAVLEVACALARKHRNPDTGRQLANRLRVTNGVQHVAVDDILLAIAEQIGTDVFLRGADALYAATAQITGTTLVS